MVIEGTIRLAAGLALDLVEAADAEVDALIGEALGVLARLTEADRGYVTSFFDDGTFANTHEWTAEGVVPQAPVVQQFTVERFAYSTRLGAAGHVWRVRTLAELPPEAAAERESFGAFGVKSVLQVPARQQGVHVATIGFNRVHEAADWDDEAVDAVEVVARAVGVVLARRRATAHMRDALDAADRANRTRDEMLSHASHELRTPLHAVIGFSEILELDGVAHYALDQIRCNGRLLLQMVDDLLKIGRLAASNGDDGVVSYGSLVAEVAGQFARVSSARAITFVAIGCDDPAAPGPAAHTIGRTRQILHCIASASLDGAGEGGAVAVSVKSDTEIDVVEFAMLGPHYTPPSGLALALARTFVDDIGGALDIEGNAIRARFSQRRPSPSARRGAAPLSEAALR